MSPLMTFLVSFSAATYALLILVDLFRKKWAALAEFLVLSLFMLLLHVCLNFPNSTLGFGESSTLISIVVLYVSILLGSIASYFFYLREKFSWLGLIRPLLISPLLLMPMWGSINTLNKVEYFQLFSLSLLAFQNGFFWKVIFERTKKHA